MLNRVRGDLGDDETSNAALTRCFCELEISRGRVEVVDERMET